MQEYNRVNRGHSDALKIQIRKKIEDLFNDSVITSAENPLALATRTWSIAIYTQWFSALRPISVHDEVFILKAPSTFAANWIQRHYLELIENTVRIVNPSLHCFIIGPDELESSKAIEWTAPMGHSEYIEWSKLVKDISSKVKSRKKDAEGKQKTSTQNNKIPLHI